MWPEQNTYQIDPLTDSRWLDLLDHHPRASVFHTRGWLEALRRTYGYQPVVFTTCAPDTSLSNGILFCHVNSWLTGRRLVSLPFSDHCEPLVRNSLDLEFLLSSLKANQASHQWKYIELRPIEDSDPHHSREDDFRPSERYLLHTIDLRPASNDLFRQFHKDSVQRRIRKAEKEGLSYECGHSESLLEQFYQLAVGTRRRHRVPPQSLDWYRNLITSLGDALDIHVASKNGSPVASIITLRFKDAVVYKYGSSNATQNHLGATPFLFWRAIERAKEHGAILFDLGRSDLDNQGLITFKDRWASRRVDLTYWRFPGTPYVAHKPSAVRKIAKAIVGYLPDSLLKITGRLVYPHVG